MAVPSNYAALVTAIDAILTTYGLSLFQVFGGRSTQPSLRELISLRWKLFSMTTPANYATLIAEIDVVIESYGLSLQEVFGGRSTQPTLQELIDLRYELFEVDGGGAIDLTAPPTNIGTTTPPAITVSTLFRSANSGNVAFVAQPFGTGAFQLQQTDSTATGGNARGANAVDLQLSRLVATQVASGINSFAAGYRNVASGTGSTTLGAENTASGIFSSAIGRGNTASGANSFALGLNHYATGASSAVLGINGNSKSVEALFALSSNAFGSVGGKSQLNQLTIGAQTTDVTPTILRSNANAAAATNQLVLQNNSSIAFFGVATATITGGGDTAAWKVEGAIKRGANAASTALVGTPTITSIGADAGAAAWTLALTADTTNGGLTVTVTGQAATTIRWTCTLFASEVAF